MSEATEKPLADRIAKANFDRLCFLADGVFAIAVTLAALEIRPPNGWNGAIDDLWSRLWPSLCAYAVSFIVIAAFWASHKRVYARLTRVDARFTGINLVLLGLVALIPAATQLLYEYGARRGALVIYAGLVAACGLVQLVAWTYGAFLAGLVDPEVTRRERVAWTMSMVVTPIFFIGVALSGAFTNSGLGLFLAGGAVVLVGVIRRTLVSRIAS